MCCVLAHLLACCILADARHPLWRHDRLLLGEHMRKNIFCPLPELKSLVGIQDQRLNEGPGLLATRFPDGFDGQAALCR